MIEKIFPQTPYVKEKEELLPNGTLVMVRNDETKTARKILESMPDDYYNHRYILEGYSFVCEKRDLIIKSV